MGCYQSAVVSIYLIIKKEPVVKLHSHVRPALTDAHEKQRLACMVRFNRQATVAQTAEELKAL